MIRSGITCRHIMVQSVYILNILSGQYMEICLSNGDTVLRHILDNKAFVFDVS